MGAIFDLEAARLALLCILGTSRCPCSLAVSALRTLRALTPSMNLCTFLVCIYIEVAALPGTSERKQSGDNS